MITITRSDYMENSSDLHNLYYGQFVTDGIENLVVSTFGIDTLKKSFSQDKYMNNIGLNLWDNIAYAILPRIVKDLKDAGDIASLGNGVCVVKAAARRAILKAEILEEVR